ncbi:MAG: LysR substrate-binding domain-containing protein [Pseudomonadota bacterium]
MRKWGPRRESLPSLNALIAVEATARLGSFRAAAQEMRVTQGAVAQQVRGVEAELAMPLFERHAKGLIPLPGTQRFIDQVRQSLTSLSLATLDLQQSQRRETSHRIILSAPPTIASRWLIPRLAVFQAQNEALSIAVDASTTIRPLTGPERVDLAIRWGREPSGCWSQLFLEGPFVVVAAPGLIAAHRPSGPQDLPGLPLITDGYDLWGEWFERQIGALPPIQGPSMSLSTLAIDAAEQGMGFALAPEPLVRGAIDDGRLALVFPPHYDLTTTRGFYVVAADQPRRGPLRKVVDWLMHEANG